MKRITFFITGTDTGVGKTVLASLLTLFLRERGLNTAALKPICSGGRGDACVLQDAMDSMLTLDEINPWHFRAPVAPVLAARAERKTVRLPPVLAHIRAMQKRFDVVLVEGAGGLLSPLGEDFNSRDLIAGLKAKPIVVCPNQLGAVNQTLLTLEALPRGARHQARVVLMAQPKPDASTETNADLLAEHVKRSRIFLLPWLGERFELPRVLENRQVRRMLGKLAPEL